MHYRRYAWLVLLIFLYVNGTEVEQKVDSLDLRLMTREFSESFNNIKVIQNGWDIFLCNNIIKILSISAVGTLQYFLLKLVYYTV